MKQLGSLLTGSTHNIMLQVPRALVASGLAAALDMGMLILLVEKAGWHPVGAAVVAYLLGGVLQYILCSCWVFPAAPQSVTFGFAAFTFLSLVGLGITWLTMTVLSDWAQLNYALAKIAALGLAFAWNFLSRKIWLFKPSAPPASSRGYRAYETHRSHEAHGLAASVR
jgi:putative flippase GtrA